MGGFHFSTVKFPFINSKHERNPSCCNCSNTTIVTIVYTNFRCQLKWKHKKCYFIACNNKHNRTTLAHNNMRLMAAYNAAHDAVQWKSISSVMSGRQKWISDIFFRLIECNYSTGGTHKKKRIKLNDKSQFQCVEKQLVKCTIELYRAWNDRKMPLSIQRACESIRSNFFFNWKNVLTLLALIKEIRRTEFIWISALDRIRAMQSN